MKSRNLKTESFENTAFSTLRVLPSNETEFYHETEQIPGRMKVLGNSNMKLIKL